jgi:hypothetical protein
VTRQGVTTPATHSFPQFAEIEQWTELTAAYAAQSEGRP